MERRWFEMSGEERRGFLRLGFQREEVLLPDLSYHERAEHLARGGMRDLRETANAPEASAVPEPPVSRRKAKRARGVK